MNSPVALFGLLHFVIHKLICVISAAGLCDINEGSATSEDRCKSPTSGNMSFSVLLKKKSGRNIAEALCYLDMKPKQWTSEIYTDNTMYLNARGVLVRKEN